MRANIKKTIAGVLLGSVVLGSTAAAQVGEQEDMDHTAHSDTMAHGTLVDTMSVNAALTEPGQGAFAALSEVVKLLEADPATDWSKVNIAALRDHLIDMDRLVRDAVVAEEVLANGIRASVTGDPYALGAAKRMVPAHAAELSKDDRWTVQVQDHDTYVLLEVTSGDPATVARIGGLGFFGLMASQDHHREHHLMFARGGSH